MLESNDSKNNKTKMIKIKKTNYSIPRFLANKFENVPAPEEFYVGYPKNDEVPFWWTRDVALPLTRKENRKAKKEALTILNALEVQRKQLELSQRRYQELLKKQEKEYNVRCELLDEQTNIKLEELKALSENNKIEYENKLMSLELELQNTNMEKQFYEKETENILDLERKSEKLVQNHLEWQEAVSALDDDISNSKEKKETIKINLHNSYKNKGLLDIEPVYNKNEATEKELKFIEKTQPKIKLESYDKKNIIEIKHLHLACRDSGIIELSNINFDVKRKEITVVYSESERVRIGIMSAIMRTLPSNMRVTNGDILVEGESISESLRDEYRKKIQSLIVSSVDIEDTIARSNKKLNKAFYPNKINTEILTNTLKIFELDPKILQSKLNVLPVETKRLLAIAVGLSIQTPLKILFDPEEDMSSGEKEKLIKAINTQKAEGAILILSANKKLISSMKDISLYSFN